MNEKTFDTVVAVGILAILFGIGWLCYQSGIMKQQCINSLNTRPAAEIQAICGK